jgi:hypothetical protein
MLLLLFVVKQKLERRGGLQLLNVYAKFREIQVVQKWKEGEYTAPPLYTQTASTLKVITYIHAGIGLAIPNTVRTLDRIISVN